MANRKEVIARLDIASVLKTLLPDAKLAGKNKLLARCPWGERHKNNDASPSFLAFLRDGGFKCQTCGEKGSIFDLYGKIHGLDYRGAITELARQVGLDNLASRTEKSRHTITGFYMYRDESGNRLYWKERIEPSLDGNTKGFCFFYGDGVNPGTAFFKPKHLRLTGRGCEPVLYNLPIVLHSHRVYFTEGEKHADLLTDWGLAASTLDSGSGSSLSDVMIEQLRGKEIIILPDNDPPGRAYAERIAGALRDVAMWIKVVNLPELPEGGDIIDWACGEGNDVMRLLEIVEETEFWTDWHEPSRNGWQNKVIPSTETPIVVHELRAFPKLYMDLARHFNDTRRFHFKHGQGALFDSLIMRMAKSSGARLPHIPSAIARELEIDEGTAGELLDIALQHGLLSLKDGYLSSPMLTEQYNNAVKMCQVNAANAAKGGKADRSKSPKGKKKSTK